jgi:hypothetical protein
MVRGRLIPTSYFRDPDVMSLSSGDVRLILVGLVLHADDYGRGLAHTVILGRDLDYPPEIIEAALAELEQADLVQCYQVGKHRYYVLTRWDDWQKLKKPTPSKLPAPPTQEESVSADFPDFSEKSTGNPGKSGERSPESESESESNRNQNRIEDEEAQPPPNVLPFPATRADAAESVFSEKTVSEATKQVATILTLPITDDLARVVADYLGRPGLSVLGEADAAAEWTSDPKRNRKRQRASPAFFRRWLKRETETARRGYPAPGTPATNTASRGGAPPAQARIAANGAGPPGAPPATDNPYHAYVNQRAEQLLQRARGKQQEEASHETSL